MLVLLTCGYQIGCADTGQAFYASNVELRNSVQYIEHRVKRSLSDRQQLYGGIIIGTFVGNDFVIPLNGRLVLKGNIRKNEVSLIYHFL